MATDCRQTLPNCVAKIDEQLLKLNKHSFRTAKDIQVLNHCEIPPIRTEFIEALGQGAFGKVHKAKLKDGLEYFAVKQDWVNATNRQTIVAVKELHGEFQLLYYKLIIDNCEDLNKKK